MSTEQNQSGRANRLATEASPYLLQHARNPVDWWPWSEEALAEAKTRDVPILLSIGYSACHWCHVMERESFEDETIAGLMNALFVNIKVDREERPDLDQIYQLVVQLMGRSGGWPLTVFLTPAQKPFFAGTYFPPEDRYGMPGFPKVLRAISEAYHARREEVEGQAAELTRAIASVGHHLTDARDEPSVLGPDLLERTSRLLLQRVDPVHGGFGRAPKFPNTMPLEVLMRRGVFDADTASVDAARRALESMRRGGIWDQLGGGFHRYSTDERWLVPHFEKMLYDNALLLRSYVDAYRAYGELSFSDTAKRILAYVEREMTDSEGGFYTSQDADSEGGEGTFFVWDESDVSSAIRTESEGAPLDGQSSDGDALAVRVALEYFGITPAGNFEEHGRPTFKTVLHEALSIRAVAEKLVAPEEDVRAALERATGKMFEARSKRPKPFRDEKILSGVSSLMIGAMAEAGMALGIPEALAAATRAFDFVVSKLVVRDAASVRALRLAKNVSGDWLVKGPGFLDDHAYLANAALDLYEATGDPDKVHFARSLVETILASFWSEDEGFFFTSKDGEALIVRSKDSFDNAVPSGAAMAIRALSRLGSLVSDVYRQRAEAELARVAPAAMENPFGFGQVICEADRVVRGATDVVLVGPRSARATQELARAAFSVWLPHRTIAWVDPHEPSSRDACALLAEGKPASDGSVAFVCRGRTCSLSLRTPDALREHLRSSGIPEA